MSEFFQASVQYDDWKGTVAADEADSLHAYFRERGVPENGFLVAVRGYLGGASDGKLAIGAIYADGDNFDSVKDQLQATDRLRLKELEIEMTFEEFFGLFKRFNFVLTSRGIGIEGREFEIQNDHN